MFKGKKVGVIGAGRSGIAAAKLLHQLGADVLLSDAKRVTQKLPERDFDRNRKAFESFTRF